MISLVHSREALVAELRERGVDYLTPTDARLDQPIDDESLIASLASHPDPRLRQALIAVFLLQPHLAPFVPRLQNKLETKAAQELTAFYMAAVYLQSMWRIRLSHYMESITELPDYFSVELGLPHVNDEYGKVGLYELAEWHANQSPYRFNHLSEYEGVADLLFQSFKLRRRRNELASAS